MIIPGIVFFFLFQTAEELHTTNTTLMILGCIYRYLVFTMLSTTSLIYTSILKKINYLEAKKEVFETTKGCLVTKIIANHFTA